MTTKALNSLFIVLLLIVVSAKQGFSQFWNPNHKIGTITGKQEFVYNQVPDQLVEIFPVTFANPNQTYIWEISTLPLSGFAAAPGTNNQASYTLPTGLTQTIYLRRTTTVTIGFIIRNVQSNTVKISLVSTDWEDINYTREYEIAVTGITTWQQVDNLPIGSKFQTTTYFDGIGRSLQQVSKGTANKGGGTWGDIVNFDKYDAYSRTEKDYLPYTTTSQPGKYKTNPETEQQTYYSTVYNETSPYGLNGYDNSPLDNIKNVKRAGTSWAANTGNSLVEEMNTVSDNVQMFSVDYVQGNAPVHRGTYPIKSLFKQIYTDVNGKKVIEYVDINGNLVLKKVQLDDNPANEYTGWICTYSIYDDFGLLRFQLQPEAVKYLFANGWSFAGTNGQQILNELCFQYDYDEKGRVVWKKAPGAQPLRMLYDSRDRVVFTQDGNQAAMPTPQWTVNLYDLLDRKIGSAHYLTSASVTVLQSDIDNAPASNTLTIYTIGAAPFTTTLSLCPILANINNYSSVTTILGYNYYDNYSFSGAQSFNTSYTNTNAYNTSEPNVKPIAWSKRALDFPTGSVTRILGTNTFLSTTNYFDEDGDHIQTSESNIKSGIDVVTKQYHFDGRLLSVCTDHTLTAAGYVNYKTLSKNVFDQIGRVIAIQKQYGGNTIKTVATYEYDDIGRLKNKIFDPGYTAAGNNYLESLDYSYNLHNEITGINKDYALKTPGLYNKWAHSFGLYLGYDNKDNVFTTGQLNGKVTGMMWSTVGDDVQRRYDFSYDNAGRLINSVFKEQVHLGDGWNNTSMDFSVSGYGGKITYDLNGNLLFMTHKGVMPGTASPITIDDLRYTYAGYSNKLQSVKDEMTVTNMNGKFGDFKDGSNGTGTPDYVYDQNGNLIIDLNKNVKDLVGSNGIVYNYLDKPEQIKIAGKGIIKIVYNATGEKLQRVFIPETGGATSTITTYIQEYVYQETSTSLTSSSTGPFSGSNLALGFINFEEGRIRIITPGGYDGPDYLSVSGNLTMPNGKMGVYDYFVTDYQQNVRVILTEENRIAGNTATMEDNRSSQEEPVFGQTGTGNEVVTSRYYRPSGWSNNSTDKVSRLGNYAGINLGPNTLQKVMAGDVVYATTKYYYESATGGSNSNLGSVVLSNLLQLLTGGSVAGGLVKDNASAVTNQLSNVPGFTNAVQNPGSGGTRPQAFLTVLFFDERFKLISEADGGIYQQQVEASWSTNTLPLKLVNVKAPKNGYMYAFISNRSDQHVYFDDFEVSIKNSNLLEESHYYSYGLKIAGISSKRLVDGYDGQAKNDHLYNDKELWDDGELNWYDYGFRNYDPQIGRFPELDPLTHHYPLLTPFQYASCDPILNIDIDGLEGLSAVVKGANAAEGVIIQAVRTTAKTSTVGTRVSGVVQGVFGVVEAVIGAVGGAGTSWTGVGAVGGALLLGNGIDNAAAGFTQAFTGKETRTYTAQGVSNGLQMAGVNQGTADMIGDYTNAGIGMVGGGMVMKAPMVAASTTIPKARIIKIKVSNKITEKVTANFEKVEKSILNPVNTGQRTGSAAYKSLNVDDSQHFFSNLVDNYVTYATKFSLKGGDNVTRDLYQISGSLRGEVGIFEWIVEGVKVTHRRFIRGGIINGLPNQIVK